MLISLQNPLYLPLDKFCYPRPSPQGEILRKSPPGGTTRLTHPSSSPLPSFHPSLSLSRAARTNQSLFPPSSLPLAAPLAKASLQFIFLPRPSALPLSPPPRFIFQSLSSRPPTRLGASSMARSVAGKEILGGLWSTEEEKWSTRTETLKVSQFFPPCTLFSRKWPQSHVWVRRHPKKVVYTWSHWPSFEFTFSPSCWSSPTFSFLSSWASVRPSLPSFLLAVST